MEKEPITIQGLEKLKKELEELKILKRPKIIRAIAEARAHGDLKENAEYHAAKDEQAKTEGRIIRINDTHKPNHVKQWMGDSIGYWEDNTLVIETKNMHPQQGFRASLRHVFYLSENAKVIERFTRVSDSEIFYQFSVDDPEVYTQVWTGEMPLKSTSNQIYEYACHEGNYSLSNILAGARAKERKE